MNEIEFIIWGLRTKIERNEKLSKQLKVLAGAKQAQIKMPILSANRIGDVHKDI